MDDQTKAAKRAAHTARCREYEAEGYTVTDKTVSAFTGNLLGILIPLPATVLLYFAAASAASHWFGPLERNFYVIPFFPLCMVLLFLHEVTHALFALPHCKNGRKSIHLGFNVKGLNPYCTCKESLLLKHYRQVLLAPLFVEGLLVVVLGVCLASHTIILLGCLMFWSSGGDMLIYLLTLRFPHNTLVLDHPYLIGCTVLRKAV